MFFFVGEECEVYRKIDRRGVYIALSIAKKTSSENHEIVSERVFIGFVETNEFAVFVSVLRPLKTDTCGDVVVHIEGVAYMPSCMA